MRAKLFLALFSLFVLSFSFFGVGARDDGYAISLQQPPQPPPNPYGGIGFMIMTIYDHGGVMINLEGVSSPASATNLGFFGVSPSDPLYDNLYFVFLSINPSSPSLTIGVSFFGNTTSNSTYKNYAISIRDTLKSKLSSYGFSLSGETFGFVYDEQNSHYFWDYTFSLSGFLNNVLFQLSYDSSSSNFSKYIDLGSDWSVGVYHNLIVRGYSGEDFDHIYYLEVQRDNVFTGNGTHQFSLKGVLGFPSLPVVEGDYYILIGNPSGAQIDPTSIDTDGAQLMFFQNNQLLIYVPANTPLSDITYSMTYNFPTQEEGGQTPGEGETGGEGGGEVAGLSLLMSYAPIAVVGVIIIVVAFVLLTKRK